MQQQHDPLEDDPDKWYEARKSGIPQQGPPVKEVSEDDPDAWYEARHKTSDGGVATRPPADGGVSTRPPAGAVAQPPAVGLVDQGLGALGSAVSPSPVAASALQPPPNMVPKATAPAIPPPTQPNPFAGVTPEQGLQALGTIDVNKPLPYAPLPGDVAKAGVTSPAKVQPAPGGAIPTIEQLATPGQSPSQIASGMMTTPLGPAGPLLQSAFEGIGKLLHIPPVDIAAHPIASEAIKQGSSLLTPEVLAMIGSAEGIAAATAETVLAPIVSAVMKGAGRGYAIGQAFNGLDILKSASDIDNKSILAQASGNRQESMMLKTQATTMRVQAASAFVQAMLGAMPDAMSVGKAAMDSGVERFGAKPVDPAMGDAQAAAAGTQAEQASIGAQGPVTRVEFPGQGAGETPGQAEYEAAPKPKPSATGRYRAGAPGFDEVPPGTPRYDPAEAAREAEATAYQAEDPLDGEIRNLQNDLSNVKEGSPAYERLKRKLDAKMAEKAANSGQSQEQAPPQEEAAQGRQTPPAGPAPPVDETDPDAWYEARKATIEGVDKVTPDEAPPSARDVNTAHVQPTPMQERIIRKGAPKGAVPQDEAGITPAQVPAVAEPDSQPMSHWSWGSKDKGGSGETPQAAAASAPEPNAIAMSREGAATPKAKTTPATAKELQADSGSTVGHSGVPPRLLEVLAQNLYKSTNITPIITKELLQNSIDSVRSLGDNGKIKMDFDPDSSRLTIEDNGHGMLPSVAANEFVTVGESAKPAGSSGGFGIANVAILKNSENIQVVSVAKRPNGRLIRTTISGRGEDWADREKGLQITWEPAPSGTPTGTKGSYTLKRSLGASSYEVTNVMNSMLGKGKLPTKLDFTTYGDAPVTPNKEAYPDVKHIKTVDVPGAKIDFHASEDTRRDKSTYVDVQVLNNGMPQFDYTKWGLPEATMPRRVVMDVHPTGDPLKPDYPFDTSREGLREQAKKAVDDWLEKELVKAAANKELQKYSMTLNKSRSMANGMKVIDTDENVPDHVLAWIANSPAISEASAAVQGAFKEMQQAMDFLDDRYKNAEMTGIGLGHDYLGINISGHGLTGVDTAKNVILINPFVILDEVRAREELEKLGGKSVGRVLAEQIANTIAHELVHQVNRNHNDKFAPGDDTGFSGTLTRTIMDINPTMMKVVGDMEKVINGNGQRALEEIENFRKRLGQRDKGTNVFGKISVNAAAKSNEQPSRGDESAEGGAAGGMRPTGGVGRHDSGEKGGTSLVARRGGSRPTGRDINKPQLEPTRLQERILRRGTPSGASGKPFHTTPEYDQILKDRKEANKRDSLWSRLKALPHNLRLDYDDMFADVVDATKAAAKKGLIWSPYEDPKKIFRLVFGGGGGPIQDALLRHRDILHDAEKAGLAKQYTQYLDLNGYLREWDMIEDKVKGLDAKINQLQPPSMTATQWADQKQAWRRLKRKLEDNLLNNKIAPQGLTRADLKQMLTDAEAAQTPADWAKIEGFAKRVYALTREVLDMLRQARVISQDSYDEMKAHPNHVSLGRILDEEVQDNPYSPTAFSVSRQNVIHGMQGSELSNFDPVERTALYHAAALRLIDRNWAAQTAAHWAQIDPTFPGRELKGGEKPGRGMGVISYLEDGVTHNWEMPATWAEAVKISTAAEVNLIGKAVLTLGRDLIQKGATGWNLGFTMKNAPRDYKDMRVFAPGQTPYNSVNAARIGVLYAKTLANLASDPAFHSAYLKSRVAFSTFQRSLTPERFLSAKRMLHPGAKMLDVSGLNAFVEDVPKATAWRDMLRQGMHPIDAAYYARNSGSPDFGVKGRKSSQAGIVWPFFNAAQKGVKRDLQFLTGRLETPYGWKENIKKLLWWVGGIALTAWVLARHNSQFYNYDDGEPEVAHTTDNDRQNYTTLFFDRMQQASNGRQEHMSVKWPKTHLEQVIRNPIEVMVNNYHGVTQPTKTQAMLAMISALLPGQISLKEDNILGSLGYGAMASLNPFIKEPIQQMMNWDFLQQSPIVGKGLEQDKPFLQYSGATPTWAVELAKLAPEHISPQRVAHLVQTIAGGTGEQASTVADFLLTMAKARRTPPYEGTERITKIPVLGPMLRGFVGSIQDGKVRDLEESFYDHLAKAGVEVKSFNDTVKSYNEKPEDFNTNMKLLENPEALTLLAMHIEFDNLSKGLSMVRTMMRDFATSDKLEKPEKQEALKKLWLGYRDGLANINALYKANLADATKSPARRALIIAWAGNNVEDELGAGALFKTPTDEEKDEEK